MKLVFQDETEFFCNRTSEEHIVLLKNFLERMSDQLHFAYGEEETLETLENDEVMYIAIPD